jgi:NAD(P)-dependent dehydrogenase (short-subunit alcohol dehydrogenase family)
MERMDLRLDGKTAVVTGGSRGIGKAIAAAFAAAGAQVMITARKAETLQQAAAEIGGVAWFAAHAGEPDGADACVRETLKRFGRLDILVNNAATNPYAGPLIDVDVPRFDKTVQVNLRGPLVWTQQAWKQWMREHGGVVINISSVGGFATNSLLGLYNVTKAALIHMTKQLAAELGPKVRVNAIAPGLIRTDFARVLWEGDRGPQVAQMYPLKRLGEPEDVAAAAVYLAADSSAWITGHTIVLDGGGLIAFPR